MNTPQLFPQHPMLSFESPKHGAPPFEGWGLLQVLARWVTPPKPQDTLQTDHFDHEHQPPSMAKIHIKYIYYKQVGQTIVGVF